MAPTSTGAVLDPPTEGAIARHLAATDHRRYEWAP